MFVSAALLLLLYTPSIASFGGETQTIRPVTESDCVFAIYTEDWGLAPQRGSQLILGLWKDGHIVWSTDQIRGGPPYRAGQSRPTELRKLLMKMTALGMFEDKQLLVSWVPVDSDFTTIFARWKGRQLLMRSRHEIEETEQAQGAIDDVPPKLRHFRNAWRQIRRRSTLLMPTQSVPVEGELVQIHGIMTWHERTESPH
jgi:hypothetical protein